MYDNHSTDNSVELAKQLGFEVVQFGTPGILSDGDYLVVKNNCWKGCTTDWVIVCDADEFVMDINVPRKLENLKNFGRTIITCMAYDVYSEYLHDSDYVTDIPAYGLRNEKYDKPLIFNPQQITEINYVPGCHSANPTGNVNKGNMKLNMYHFRYIGGPQRLIDRHALYRQRLSAENIRKLWGTQYLVSDEERTRQWNQNFETAKNEIHVY